ncbi:MAG: hypothetical protein NVSMB1_05010 [Polyangiales bacterium]
MIKWFFAIWGSSVGVLFLGFVAWIATRTMHLDAANYYVGKVIVYDLYALALIMCYVAFVGGFHIWERLTGRMELDVDHRRERSRERRAREASGSAVDDQAAPIPAMVAHDGSGPAAAKDRGI